MKRIQTQAMAQSYFHWRFLMLLCFGVTLGCGVETVTYATQLGDSITNNDGLGTGQVAGVTFKISGLESTSAGITHAAKRTETDDGSSGSDRWDVELGGIKIVLERINEDPISLTVDGSHYGTVTQGDELSIDKTRIVKVNGIERTAQ